MKLFSKKLNLQQKLLLYSLTIMTVVLVLANIFISQQVKTNNQQLNNKMSAVYEEESFSFIVTDKGKFISSAGSLNELEKEEILDNSSIDLQNKLAEHNKFQYKTVIGEDEYNLTMTPVIGTEVSEFIYLGQAFPQNLPVQSAHQNLAFLWIAFFLELFIIGFIILYISRKMTQPLKFFGDFLREMADGNITTAKKLNSGIQGFWAQMVTPVNRFIDHYVDKIRFASEIEKGNIDVNLNVVSENDQLGQSLLRIKDSLKEAKEEAKRREAEEEKRRWANEGIAKFSDLLRKNHDNLENLSYSIISHLVQYLDANQGGFFLLNDNDPENLVFELKAAYAFNRRKYLTKNVKMGEGLVGTCAQEGKYIYMTDIPQDYIKITSGLGGANPGSLLIVPLKTDEKVVGVLEIASFNEFDTYQIEFVEKVAESIASTISSVKINLKTNQLLQKSQQQAEEMASQEEEMRQNMEEMQATQEELSRKMKSNEEMQEQLKNEKALLDALMNNLPDFIYFKDMDSKFIRVSRSMLPLFPVDTIEEMIGKSDFDFHQADAAKEMYEEEMEIIRNEKGFQDKIQHEITETGKDQWVSVTKLPLYDPDGQLMGTFGISKDVTQFKKLEIELMKQKGNDKNNESGGE